MMTDSTFSPSGQTDWASRPFWPWLAGSLGLLGVILTILSWKNAIVNADAGYYLSLVEAAARGEVWYRDLFIGYAPLSLYGFRLIRWLFGPETQYGHYLGSILLLHLLNASLLLVLLGKRNLPPWPRLAMSALYLTLVLTYEGENILLEPLCTTFLLLSLWPLSSRLTPWKQVLLSSLLVAGACLCKQYGGLMGLGIAAWILSQLPQFGWRKTLGLAGLSLGTFLGGLLGMAVLLGQPYGLAWDRLLLEWLGGIGRGYGDFALGWGALIWGKNLLISLPLLVLVPWVWKTRKGDPWLWLLTIGFLGLSLPLYVKTFQHYWLLPLPIGILLMEYVWQHLPKQRLQRLASVLLGMLLLLTTVRAGLQMGFLWRATGERHTQYEVAAAIHAYLPPGTPSLLLPTHAQSLNYLADLRPVDPVGSGYAFPVSFDPTYFQELLESQPPILTDQAQRAAIPWQIKLAKERGYQLRGEIPGEVPLEMWMIPTQTSSQGTEPLGRIER